MLKNNMLKASDLKLDLKKGTIHLSKLAAQKSSFLCEIVATASKIRDKIQNCKLVYKLRKRLAEQSQCKNKDLPKVMEPELRLKCLNTDLLWAKGYHNLEIRNVKHIPANTNLLELQNYASLIEQETVVDSNIITNPNRQKKKDFLLEHFLVMSASRSGNLILINIHNFLLSKDDLMSLLYIDEEEADEAPPEKVYKEKVFGPPKKRGRKPLYEKFR